MPDREARPRPASPWPVIIVGALALFGAVTLVQWVFGFLFGLVKLAIVVAVVVLAVVIVRGPPDGQRGL